MAKRNYGLGQGVTIFYDDESELKVTAGETVELDEDNVTPKTATALMSGALVKVKTSGKSEKKTDGYPEDFPGREDLVKAGVEFDSVKDLSDDDLNEIDGIGPATFKAIRNYK